MKIDLHNHSLEEAKEGICYSLEECRVQNDSILKIIHGHKHGTVIRDYVRSNHFLTDTKKLGHAIISKNCSDEGKTTFNLKHAKNQRIEESPTINSNRKKDYVCHKCNKLMVPVEGLSWVKCPTCGKFQKI